MQPDALIARQAKVDVTNEFGSTPLAEAVKLADARVVKKLLDAGAGVEGANQDGETLRRTVRVCFSRSGLERLPIETRCEDRSSP